MATTKATEVVTIRPIEMQIAIIRIEGVTPIIFHKWSEKARRETLKLGGELLKRKVPRNPWAEGVSTLWFLDEKENPFPSGLTDSEYEMWLEKYKTFTEEDYFKVVNNSRFGFPVSAFKEAGLAAIYREGLAKNIVSMRGAFFIEGVGENQLVEIKPGADAISVREDAVRLQGTTADFRYRTQFERWSAELKVSYNRNGRFTLSEIANIIAYGGRLSGVGEWRIEKGGPYGAFRVV